MESEAAGSRVLWCAWRSRQRLPDLHQCRAAACHGRGSGRPSPRVLWGRAEEAKHSPGSDVNSAFHPHDSYLVRKDHVSASRDPGRRDTAAGQQAERPSQDSAALSKAAWCRDLHAAPAPAPLQEEKSGKEKVLEQVRSCRRKGLSQPALCRPRKVFGLQQAQQPPHTNP